MNADKFVKQGLTFDDVLLIPAASDQENYAEHSCYECRYGHRYRVSYGNCHCS